MHSDEPNAPAEPNAPIAEAPAPTPAADDPETVRALARDTLAWCRENPADPEALPKLNTVLELVHDPKLSKEVLAAGQAVTRHAIGDTSNAPATHAHMTVLMALLLEYEPTRDGVDALFVEWLRHERSYGPAHATPAHFQRESFVQRLGDLLGWGSIDVKTDRAALTRFAHWVDTWTPKNKFRAKRALDAVRRNFPAPEVWGVIRFPQGGEHGGRPAQNNPRGPRPDAAKGAPAKDAPRKDAQPTDAQPGAQSPSPAQGGEGKRRRRRRNRNRNRDGQKPAGEAGEGAGNVKSDGEAAGDDDGGDDGDDNVGNA